jgi:tRNA(Ile)-lysidine synthase
MNKAADLLPRLLGRVEHVPKSAPCVVGVSGGCDSVVLLDLLRRAGFTNLVVAHFHHGLRGATATRDAEFVKKLAEASKSEFVLGRGRTRARAVGRKESIEEAARHLRRKFFAKTAKSAGATALFLAHHANDAAETVLFHLARGSGLRGLTSLRATAPLEDSNALVLRPLLGCTRQQIEHYAKARRLAFCTDETNFSRDHTRNKLRHDVLPALAGAVMFDPAAPMARAAEILAEEDDWIESMVAAEASLMQIELRPFRQLPVAHQRRLLRAWLRARTGREVDFDTIEQARRLALSSSAPAKINLPRGHHCRRRAGKLFVEKPKRIIRRK